jgi:biotin carboxyl carrier protein
MRYGELRERRVKLKLRITIEGKTYEAEVEILEAEDSGPSYTSYPPVTPTYPTVSMPPAPTQGLATEAGGEGQKAYHSPVTGLVIKVNVGPGQAVQPGDLLMVLEAMKMETQVTATQAGTVKNVLIVAGKSVKVHQVLLELE